MLLCVMFQAKRTRNTAVYRGVDWVIFENDWYHQAMCLARPSPDGGVALFYVGYKAIDDIKDHADVMDAYTEANMGSYKKNPERFGFRYGPLVAEEEEVPADVLAEPDERFVPKMRVRLLIYVL